MREAEEKIKSGRHKIEREAVTVLCNYQWLGNVRELRHLVEMLVATTMDEEITADDVRRAMPSSTSFDTEAQVPRALRKRFPGSLS